MKNSFLRLALLLCVLFSLGYANNENVVNVYSHRHYATDLQIFNLFTKETGIKVNLVQAKAKELIKRIQAEGSRTPADVLITVDAGNLATAKSDGLLQAVHSKYLDKTIPPYLRDKDDEWFGITERARVTVIAKKNIGKIHIKYYEDLAKPKYKGMIMVRSSSNIYNQSLLAAMIAHHGKAFALKWAKGIVANMTRSPRGNDIYQVAAVGSGIGKIAIVNTYYVGKMSVSKNFTEQMAEAQSKVIFPHFKNGGTHVNISGIALIKYSKHKKNAIRFMKFLLSKEAQKLFAHKNFEYPILKSVKSAKVVKGFGKFKRDTIPLSLLGKYNKDAVEIFDTVGWR